MTQNRYSEHEIDVSKGQLISKGPFSVIVSTKIHTNEFFSRISVLASKKGGIKKG